MEQTAEKQIFQMQHNMVKNPNWQEADQLAINKRSQGVKRGVAEKQFQLAARAGLQNLGPPDYKSGALNTRPRCLPIIHLKHFSIHVRILR